MEQEANERERFARSKKGKAQQQQQEAAEKAAAAAPAPSPAPLVQSETEATETGLASSVVDADDENSPGEDTAGSTTDNTASTAAATAGTVTTAGGVTPPTPTSRDAADAAAGVGYDADREGGGGEDLRRQKTQQQRGSMPGSELHGEAGDVADYDGDAEGVGGGKNGSRQANAAAASGAGVSEGPSAAGLSVSGRATTQVKKTSTVMDLIREKEAAAAKAVENPTGERQESAAALSPSFAAVRRRKQVDTRTWSSSGTVSPAISPESNGTTNTGGGGGRVLLDGADADGETSGGAEAGAESEGTGRREPWASRAPVDVSENKPLSPSMAAARTRSGRGGVWGGAAGSDASDASSTFTPPPGRTATTRGVAATKGAPVASTGISTIPNLWPPSPGRKSPAVHDPSSFPSSSSGTATTGGDMLVPGVVPGNAGGVAALPSVIARIGNYENGAAAASAAGGGSGKKSFGGIKKDVGSSGRGSLIDRIGSFEKAASRSGNSAGNTPSKGFGATVGGGVNTRIGSVENQAASKESGTKDSAFQGSATWSADSGGKSRGGLVSALAAKVGENLGASMGSAEKPLPKPRRGPIGGPFDEEEVQYGRLWCHPFRIVCRLRYCWYTLR